MDKESFFLFLKRISQTHLLEEWEMLPEFLRQDFICQVSKYSEKLFWKQRETLKNEKKIIKKLSPLKLNFQIDPDAFFSNGLERVLQGKVATLILAGGQGTRLGCAESKGCLFLPKLQKSLFQIHLEKCLDFSKKSKKELPIAIMTSSQTFEAVSHFLKKHSYFGLSKSQVFLFYQKNLPFLDKEGNWFLESPWLLAEGPSGNGEAFQAGKSVFRQWKQDGIKWLVVIPIDNPLASPYDPALLGHQVLQKTELAIRTIHRKKKEKVGIIGEKEGKIVIEEYFEATNDSEEYPWGYSGIFSCDIDFIGKALKKNLSWHTVLKNEKKLVRSKHFWRQEQQKAWKFETFIFDFFPLASSSCILPTDRKDCFLPLKDLEGEFGLETVQNTLLERKKKSLLKL